MAYLLSGARLVDPQINLDAIRDILVEGDLIAQVGENLASQHRERIDSGEVECVDCSGMLITPGLVDIHVHLREPGGELKEDIASGTRAAAHGGFTDVCCMPNTKPIIDNALGVEYIYSRAEKQGKCKVHVAGACSQGLQGETLSEMGDMVAHGAVAFTDDGRGIQGAGMMRRVMDYASMFNVPVMVHCQDEDLVGEGQINEGPISTKLGMLGWPAAGEEIEIARDIILCRLTGCPLHIQHISTAHGLNLVRQAKAEGLPVTCEVTPHHLFLSDEDITSVYDTNFKVNPPLRRPSDNKALIEGLLDGSIDCIVTDHAPHTDFEKAREFELAPFGMTGLETSFALMYTNLVGKSLMSLSQMVELMAVAPRKILRLDKVSLEAGSKASLSVFDLESSWTVTEDCFVSKSKNSAFVGQTLQGRARDVLCEGKYTLKNFAICED